MRDHIHLSVTILAKERATHNTRVRHKHIHIWVRFYYLKCMRKFVGNLRKHRDTGERLYCFMGNKHQLCSHLPKPP